VLPKQLHSALGLVAGSKVDISWYGVGIQITLGGGTAQLERNADGRLVVRATTEVTDEAMFALIDASRR